jgi:hypothetical protein
MEVVMDGRWMGIVGCAAAVLLAASGCGSSCGDQAPRCNGKQLEYCTTTGDHLARSSHWVSRECAVACVAISSGPACVASTAPVPECARDGKICVGGLIASCDSGYLVETPKACFGASDTCVETSCGGTCLPAGVAPEPRCAAGGKAFCDGDTLVSCRCGYAGDRRSCGSAELCITRGGDAACVSSTMLDPQCDPMVEVSGYCDEQQLGTSCWWGYVVNRVACGTYRCTVSSTGVGCSS